MRRGLADLLSSVAIIAVVALAAALGARQEGAGRHRLPWEPPEGNGLLSVPCALAAAVGLGACTAPVRLP